MTAENPWKEGDIVQLKSGGPAMTVAGTDMIGKVICEWFVGTTQKSSSFNAGTLKKYEAPSMTGFVARG